MASSSRWGQQSSSSRHPFPSSSAPIPSEERRRHPTDGLAVEDSSFLWLSSSYHAEGPGRHPLAGVEDEFDHSGSSKIGGASTVEGKSTSSRGGNTKMSTQPSRANAPSSSLAVPGSAATDSGLDSSKYRSSWTSTDSDKSHNSNASISPSDFEFLTPSFIAMDSNVPVISGGYDALPTATSARQGAGFPSEGDGRNGSRGAKGTSGNGGLSVPGSKRVTGDSQTLGKYMDRESSLLAPSSVRGAEGASPAVEHRLDAVAEQDGGLSDASRSRDPISPTQPLNVSRKPVTSPRALPEPPQSAASQHQKSGSSSSQQTAGGATQSLTSPQRYYHQPPPRKEQQRSPLPEHPQLRHVRSTGTTSSAETTSSSRQPISSTRSHQQLGSMGSGTTYPPTAYHTSSHLRRNESQSKASGYSANSGAGYIASASVSPSTSLSASLPGGPGGASHEAGGSSSSHIAPATGLMAVRSGAGRSRADSDGRHPYANSSAYRSANTTTTTDDSTTDERQSAYTQSPFGTLPSRERDQHPFASYRPQYHHQAQRSQASVPPTTTQEYHLPRRRDGGSASHSRPAGGSSVGGEGYVSDGSAGRPGGGGRYEAVQGSSAPSSSRPSPRMNYSKPSSNAGHGGLSGDVSEVERDSGAGRYLNVPKAPVRPNGESAAREDATKKEKKEKRHSAATLLSLRIRNVYPVSRGSAPFTNTSAAPRPPSKATSGEKYSTSEEDGAPSTGFIILRWCGISLIYLVIASVIPALGTIYGVVGHTILRAKAQSDANSLPEGMVSTSTYLQAPISSTAQAGAAGGAILAIPILLVIFIAVGPDALGEYKNAVLKWMKLAVSPSAWIEDGTNVGGDAKSESSTPATQQEKKSVMAERRRSRRASSLWGPNAASISFKEQSSMELAINVCVNILLAMLFLCLGAGCTSLGVTVLSPSSPPFGPGRKVFLSTSTAALSGLLGGAIIFGGTVIIGGVLVWVIYEGGKPVDNDQRQLAAGSVDVRGRANHGTTKSLGGSTFYGGQPTIGSVEGHAGGEPVPPARWV